MTYYDVLFNQMGYKQNLVVILSKDSSKVKEIWENVGTSGYFCKKCTKTNYLLLSQCLFIETIIICVSVC